MAELSKHNSDNTTYAFTNSDGLQSSSDVECPICHIHSLDPDRFMIKCVLCQHHLHFRCTRLPAYALTWICNRKLPYECPNCVITSKDIEDHLAENGFEGQIDVAVEDIQCPYEDSVNPAGNWTEVDSKIAAKLNEMDEGYKVKTEPITADETTTVDVQENTTRSDLDEILLRQQLHNYVSVSLTGESQLPGDGSLDGKILHIKEEWTESEVQKIRTPTSSKDKTGDARLPNEVNQSGHDTVKFKSHKRRRTGVKPSEHTSRGENCTQTVDKVKRGRIHRQERFQCLYCGKYFTHSRDLAMHEKVHTGKSQFKCKYCGKHFSRASHLAEHERIHTGEKPFKCTYCEMSFRYQGKVKVHERIHTGDRPYKCSYCDESFIRSGLLTAHEKRHRGEKPFMCTYCGKCFASLVQLQAHERIHTGERLFSCTICKKSYVQSSSLKDHKRTHSGEKPFMCAVCGKTFKTRGSQRNHEKVHSGEKHFKCTYCEKFFASGNTMRKHERIHTGEKPFLCSHCDKKFRQKQQLTYHEQAIHGTGEKSFKCSVCGANFRMKRGLVSHEKRKHCSGDIMPEST